MHISQVPGTVEGMKPRVGQVGGVANVMQPSSGLKKLGVITEDRGQGPGSRGHSLDVCPAVADKFKKLRASSSAQIA